ncbi:MAG: RNA-dependent RNA polymerase [Sanya phenuivirus 2]|nr:MAG: RNA-dependent RNA polymerase [Sanya phenuivirus 2]
MMASEPLERLADSLRESATSSELIFNPPYFYSPDVALTNTVKLKQDCFTGILVTLVPGSQKMQVTFQCTEEFSSVTSGTHEDPLLVDVSDPAKIRHEFVAEYLASTGTDKKLSSVYEWRNDGEDNATPDFIYTPSREPKFNLVLELATTVSDSFQTSRNAFHKKMYTYSGAVASRSEVRAKSAFVVLVVSRSAVVSNVKIPESMTRELVLRFRLIDLACKQLEGISNIVTTVCDEHSSEIERRVSSCIDRLSVVAVPVLAEGPAFIKDDEIDALRSNPDLEVVQARLKRVIVESGPHSLKVKKEQLSQRDDDIEKWRAATKEGERRTYKKPVCPFPFCVPKFSEKPTVDLEPRYLMARDTTAEADYLVSIWNKAFSMSNIERISKEDPNKLLEEAYATNNEDIETLEKSRKAARRNYHRVCISGLSKNEERYLMKDGIWAKRFDGQSEKVERERVQKLAYAHDIEVDDIDDILSDVDLWEQVDTRMPESLVNYSELVEVALSHQGGISHGEKKIFSEIQKILTTRMAMWSYMISDVATEVLLSMKQNTNLKHMILKKLRHMDVFVLLSPTNSKGHCFWSLYIPNPTFSCHSTVFKKAIRVNDGFVTPFHSANAGKLFNLVSALPSLISLCSYWSWHYRIPARLMCEQILSSNHIRQMITFSVLVRLEDKAKTEEAMTLSRYMFMEIFKSNQVGSLSLMFNSPPDPMKLVPKFNKYPRSRLEVYIQNKLITAFSSMLENPPIRVGRPDDSENQEDLANADCQPSKDTWIGLINPITGVDERQASRVINLFYIGYLKNKGEKSEKNTDWNILEKALEEELKYTEGESKYAEGQVAPLDHEFGDHEYCPEVLKYGAEKMGLILESKYGPRWKEFLDREVVKSLARNDLESMATLKASSTYTPDELKSPAVKGGKDKPRKKVMEAIVTNVQDFESSPYEKFDDILGLVEREFGGVVADLFKKQQHGGLREIYVLEIHSRMVQLWLETISRVVCSEFPNEALTHPKNKMSSLEEHRVKSAVMHAHKGGNQDRTLLSFFSSLDKTRWNQNFMMKAFFIILSKMMPERYSRPIARCLNLWTNKKIVIPQQVVEMVLTGVSISSSVYERFSQIYLDPDCKHTLKGGLQQPRCVTMRTGMMQGILHYTSSLVHVGLLSVTESMIPALCRASDPGSGAVVSTVCSSDDSALAVSVSINSVDLATAHSMLTLGKLNNVELTDEDVERIKSLNHDDKERRSYSSLLAARTLATASLAGMWMNCLSKYFCMKPSVKDTVSVLNYVEFNSEFLLENTLSVPTLKYSAASLTMNECEDFKSRFHMMHNTLSDLSSSGMSNDHVVAHNMSQALLHYMSVGLMNNPLFTEWKNEVMIRANPICGFFLLENALSPCIMGYAFTNWLWNRSTSAGLANQALQQMTGATIGQDGTVYTSIVCKAGDNKNWRNFIDRVNVKGEDVDGELMKNPEQLFVKSRNKSEMLTLISVKSRMPGVARAMTSGDQFAKAMSMSIYSLYAKCLTKSEMVEDPTKPAKMAKKTSKISLLQYTQEENARDDLRWMIRGEKERLELFVFPNTKLYERVLERLLEISGQVPVETGPLRKVKTTVRFSPEEFKLPVSLMDACKFQWFGIPVGVAERVVRRCWMEYRTSIPWMTDTFKGTMIKAGFDSPIELYNFVSRQSLRSRTFTFVGPSLFSGATEDQVSRFARMNYSPREILRPLASKEPMMSAEKSILRSKLALLGQLPSFLERDARVVELLETSELIANHDSISNLSARNQTLLLLQLKARGQLSEDRLREDLERLRGGKTVVYTMPQMRDYDRESNVVRWRGKGEIEIRIEELNMRLSVTDDKITGIVASSELSMSSYRQTLADIFRSMGLKDLAMKMPHFYMRGQKYEPQRSYSDYRLTISQLAGTPVFFDCNLKLTDTTGSPTKLRVTSKGISIVGVGGRLAEGYSLVEYKFRDFDIVMGASSNVQPDDLEDYLQSFVEVWENQVVLTTENALTWLVLAGKKEKSDPFRIAITQILLERCSYLGLLCVDGQMVSEIATYTDQIDDEELRRDPAMAGLMGMGSAVMGIVVDHADILQNLSENPVVLEDDYSREFTDQLEKDVRELCDLRDENPELIKQVILYSMKESYYDQMDTDIKSISDLLVVGRREKEVFKRSLVMESFIKACKSLSVRFFEDCYRSTYPEGSSEIHRQFMDIVMTLMGKVGREAERGKLSAALEISQKRARAIIEGSQRAQDTRKEIEAAMADRLEERALNLDDKEEFPDLKPSSPKKVSWLDEMEATWQDTNPQPIKTAQEIAMEEYRRLIEERESSSEEESVASDWEDEPEEQPPTK